MKFLQDYQEQKQTKLLKITGSFFAYTPEQFKEQKKEGMKYVNMGNGLICESDHVQELIIGLDKIHTEAIHQDIIENTIDGIIERELYNHEAFYTGDIKATLNALKGYHITKEQVNKVYNRKCSKSNL